MFPGLDTSHEVYLINSDMYFEAQAPLFIKALMKDMIALGIEYFRLRISYIIV